MFSYPYPHADANPYSDASSITYTYANIYGDTHSDSYFYATTTTDASNKTVAQRSSYSATEAESLIPG